MIWANSRLAPKTRFLHPRCLDATIFHWATRLGVEKALTWNRAETHAEFNFLRQWQKRSGSRWINSLLNRKTSFPVCVNIEVEYHIRTRSCPFFFQTSSCGNDLNVHWRWYAATVVLLSFSRSYVIVDLIGCSSGAQDSRRGLPREMNSISNW